MDTIKMRVKDEVLSKSEQIVSYAVAISPVYSGKYIESFSVKSRGGGGGRARTSPYARDVLAGTREHELSPAQKQAHKEKWAGILRSEVLSIDPLESEGFVLRNRAPHANLVEQKHVVFARVRDRFRGR